MKNYGFVNENDEEQHPEKDYDPCSECEQTNCAFVKCKYYLLIKKVESIELYLDIAKLNIKEAKKITS